MKDLQNSEITGYRIGRILGSGSFATVYLAEDVHTGDRIAVKSINVSRLDDKLIDNLKNEITIMRKVKHQNIVKLIEVQYTENYIHLIMEYCDQGDLATLIHSVKKLTENRVRVFIQQITSALEFLRTMNIVHRDLKPHNILLQSLKDSEEPVIKIADFGFARSVSNDLAETLCGSPLYMAPEVLSYEKYDSKADLWSLGVAMYEMLIGVPPFQAANHIQLLRTINDKWDSVLGGISENNELSESCRNLLGKLLQKNPTRRLEFSELFSHSFICDEIQIAPHTDLTIYPPFGRSKGKSGSIYSTHHPSSQDRISKPASPLTDLTMLGFPIQKTGHALRKLLVAHRVSSELCRKYSGQKLDIKGISSLNASILIHIYQKAAINESHEIKPWIIKQLQETPVTFETIENRISEFSQLYLQSSIELVRVGCLHELKGNLKEAHEAYKDGYQIVDSLDAIICPHNNVAKYITARTLAILPHILTYQYEMRYCQG